MVTVDYYKPQAEGGEEVETRMGKMRRWGTTGELE